MFKPLLGFESDAPSVALGAEPLKLVASGAPPEQFDAGWHSEPLVQVYSDCVPRSCVKAKRRRIILQRTPERRFELGPPALSSSRWAYWQWLESIGRLGDSEAGTQPYTFVALLNQRGWCAEQYMPYLNEDGSAPGVDIDAAPPISAIQHAHDQKGKLKAHFAETNNALRLALSQSLTACVAIAVNQRFVDNSGGTNGIPADPSYVWNFNSDPGSRIVGWHMMEVESYNRFGPKCQNTWGPGFADNGYVRVGWETLALAHLAMSSLVFDWVPDVSEAYSL